MPLEELTRRTWHDGIIVLRREQSTTIATAATPEIAAEIIARCNAYPALVELLDDLSAMAETMLPELKCAMSASQVQNMAGTLKSRDELIKTARRICTAMLRPEDLNQGDAVTATYELRNFLP